ncbi:LysE family transporter [Algibacter pectinivorans]|uniref:Threonine/homoserine/homoserine lactone efflux protein n=1 Tax=Algibacter pectinivorans TaxID=870482 RepID=A0A1I1N4R1_9FLAO|nr:LysE family transporter [Algibacter pectinivorans]SFC92651.1 Threonine/homoserine/homoserine lactone efflux protein [Algibacter pectinivorans]
MILVYLFIGILAAVLSALPLGASNIAVINTTLKQNSKQAFKIAIAAGFAEVILSLYALDCNKTIQDFFNNNLWVQTGIAGLLFFAGTYLFFKKQTEKKSKKTKLTQSKYATGFLLGIVNPPVLIYWVIAFGVLHNNDIMLSLKSSASVLFLFFIGVYLGKVLTLYFYSSISLVIKSKVQNITLIVNKATGVLLIAISIVQVLNIYIA